jgi:acyl carrier protein
MSNLENYKKIFIDCLAIDAKNFHENLKYNEVEEWDSIGHMTLISGLEDSFKISLDTDDIVEFGSYKKGIEILKKYKIKF